MSDKSLKSQINAAVKAAMRSGEKDKLAALRLITAAIKQREIDGKQQLADKDVLDVLDKMIKQRRDSISQFATAARDDLIAIEEAEIAVIEQFLPQQLSQTEIEDLVKAAIATTNATGMAQMGQVMAKLRPQLAGRADVGAVSQQVKAILSAQN